MDTTNTATYENRTFELPAGLSLRENGKSFRCDDCGAWAWLSESVRHSKRCDTQDLQAVDVTPSAPAPVNAQGRAVKVNQYSGCCESCGRPVAAGAGERYWALSFDDGGEYGRKKTGWAVRHMECA